MKIISFNINGLRARLHQLQAIIDKHQPDIIGLQEIKVHNDAFPVEAVEAMGYHVYFHGQKAHYGVAMLCKKEPIKVQRGFPSDDEEKQKRMIMVTTTNENGEEITVLNGYFPEDNVIVMGDINISPIDLDIGIGEPNRKRWLKTGKCSFQLEEREWLAKLLNWGFNDTFRMLTPEKTERYSWFDYRSRGFDDNRGLRIDVILATKNIAQQCTESEIDYELRAIEKPSDHAPIWATFK